MKTIGKAVYTIICLALLAATITAQSQGWTTTFYLAFLAVATPGVRKVTVDLPPRKGFSLGTQETFELTASPCMRYLVAARLDTETGQHWKPVVRASESIGECLTKFKGGTTPK